MADQEKEVTIRYTVKNLTGPETEAVRKAIAGVATAAAEATKETGKLPATLAAVDAEAKTLTTDLQHAQQVTEKFGGPEVRGHTDAFGASLASVDDKAKGLGGSLGGMLPTLKSLAAGFGIAFGVQQVMAFAGEVFNAADKVKDLSDRTGISIEMTQRLGYAARNTGSTIDVVAASVLKLSDNLVEGSDNTRRIVASLGLSIEDLRAQKPEEAFLRITDAIQTIADPMQQTNAAIALFGRSGTELLPGIREGFRGLADSATVMSETTVRELEAAKQEIENFKNWAIVKAGEAIAAIRGIPRAVTAEAGDRTAADPSMGFANAKAGYGFGDQAAMEQAKRNATASIQLNRELGESVAALYDKFKVSPLPDYVRELAEAEAAVRKLDPAYRAQIDAALKLGHSIEEVGQMYRLTTVQQRVYTKVADDDRAAAERAVEAKRKLTEQEQKHAAMVTAGVDAMERATVNLVAIERFSNNAWPAVKQHGAAWEEVDRQVDRFNGLVSTSIDSLGKLPGQIPNLNKVLAPPPITEWEKFGKGLQQVIQNALQGGGNVGESIGGYIGGQIGDKAAKKVGESLGKMIGGVAGTFLGPLGSIAGGWLGGKIGGMFGGGEGKNVNDIRDEFAATHGGLDKIHQKLVAIGREDLFKPLAFGPAKVDAIKKAIADVEGALRDSTSKQAQDQERLAAAMERYGYTWEDLNEKAKTSHVAEWANELIGFHDILAKQGIDQSDILQRQAEDWSALVQAALRTGTEIPSAARKAIDELHAMGKLVDENGNVLDDQAVAGLKWSKTMTEGFQTVSDSIGQLGDKLAYIFGVTLPESMESGFGRGEAAATKFGRTVQRLPTPGYDQSTDDGVTAHTGGHVVAREIKRYHSGGLASDEVRAVLQRGEYVVSRSDVNAIGARQIAELLKGRAPSTTGSAQTPIVNVYVDGQQVAATVRVAWRRNPAERREAAVTLAGGLV